jgi:alanine racemase
MFMQKHLIINKDIYQENYLTLIKYLNKKPAAVLKNNAYGMGLEKVALILQEVECEQYFIYNIYEGITLRKILNQNKEIFSLSSIQWDNLDVYKLYNIIPIVSSIEEIHLYKTLLQNISFGIYFDIGFNCRGISWEDSAEVYNILKIYNLIYNIKYIIAHLSSAWEIDLKENKIQKQHFEDIRNIFGHNTLYSLCNTDASRLSGYVYDIPRIGKGLHGVSFYKDLLGVKQAFRLEGQIIQIKRIKTGETIGYGNDVIAHEDMNIGILNIGSYHIKTINFYFTNKAKWQNNIYNILVVCSDFLVINFEQDIPDYLSQVEVLFCSSLTPKISS